MIKEDREFLVWVVSVLITFFFALPFLYAEENAASAQNPLIVSEQTIQKKLEYWKSLKQKDPATFDQIAQKRKEQIKEKMSFLKEKNPQKFEALQGAHLERRRNQLQKMRRENPAAFRQVMQQKEARLRKWSENNPERYQKFLQNHPRIAQGIEKGNLVPGRPEDRERFQARNQERMENGRPENFPNPNGRQPFKEPRENFQNREKPYGDNRFRETSPFSRPGRPAAENGFQNRPSSQREGIGPRESPRPAGSGIQRREGPGGTGGNNPPRQNASAGRREGGSPRGGAGSGQRR